MLVFLLLLIIIIRFLTYIWSQRKIISLYFKVKCDLIYYPILGHAYLFFGSPEDKMTAFKKVGKEAIKHGGITRIWAINRMYLVIADAKLAKVIFKGCLEKSDIMKISHNLFGNGSVFASDTTLGCQVDALRNLNQPFLRAFDEYCHMTTKRYFAPWLHSDTPYSILNWKIKKHIKTMHDFVDEIIKAKRKAIAADAVIAAEANPKYDPNDRRSTLLDQLINTTFKSDGLSDLELRHEMLVIMLAGSDTSATGMAFVLMMLAKFQDIQEKVYYELHDIFGSSHRAVTPEDLLKMEYLNNVIKETLRLYPPGPMIVRKTHTDTVLPTGLVLPKDTDIMLNIWSINRNPQYWGENAEQFDPSRFSEPLPHPAAMATFSYGSRNCIGYQYAYMSMKTVISTVLRRFRVLPAQKSNGSKELRVKIDISMKEVEDFPIKLEKRTFQN